MGNQSHVTLNLEKFRKKYIFSRYRFHLRKLLVPVFILFSVVDFIYEPDKVFTWFCYRFIFGVVVWSTFYFVFKYKKIRDKLNWIASIHTIIACNIVNLMILQSGGYQSKYFIGVILCAIAGVQLFKLNKIYSLTVQACSYLPSIIILMCTAPATELKYAIIQSLFFMGMGLLSYIFGFSDDDNINMLMKLRYKMKVEIERLNRTEMLKKFFPIAIRKEIENNINYVPHTKIVNNLIVGFADISNSSEIANSIELTVDWNLKEKFLEAATNHALTNNMVVLTHIGDGFLFLVNYVDKDSWQENLVTFYKTLIKEYAIIYANTVGMSGTIQSGVKFGVAKGNVMVGFLGKDQAYYTAIGPAVNLASRVCSKASANELVVTKDVWQELSVFTASMHQQVNHYSDLKGFKGTWDLIKYSNTKITKENTCEICSGILQLALNEDGQLDYVCENCASKLLKTG